ncbi:hypothetical protein HUU39_28145 [candidate division KSB1 bacterium]|nr:hypothetical protein [bacterium]NUM69093.1 hypothetical protein [candidate division KSB1 bacterium]
MPPANATQFQNTNHAEICDVVIGIDFGTSCSKVVLQSPYFADRRAMLVPFGDLGHPINSHLLPTKLYYDRQGNCSLATDLNSLCTSGIKLRLLQNPDIGESLSDFAITPRTLAIAYIALVLRHARQWFLTTQSKIYGNFRIRWHLNIGIPSPGYDDHDRRELFKCIAADAWRFSLGTESVSLARIWQYFEGRWKPNNRIDIESDAINVMPEIVAEVLGYAKSNLRENGLHVLIDIGAGTIDISGFILHNKEGEDRYSFLTSDLDHLGAYHCHLDRVQRIKEHVTRWFSHLAGRQDLAMPIMASLPEYFPRLADFGTDAEKDILEEFYTRCRALVHRTLKSLKKNRDPNSERWKTGLPIFFCGGGKSLSIYRRVLDDLHECWQTSMATRGLKIIDLPKPANLVADSLDEQLYDRFAVAYGLSYPYYDIGEIRPPGSISNVSIDPTPKYAHIEYVSKDLV